MRNRRDRAEERPPTAERVDPDAAYWTEQRLRYGSGGLNLRRGRPVDYRARDRAEIALVRPPHLPPQGRVRAQIRARRASAAARLSELDEDLRKTFEQRRRLVDRIERCSLAMRGLGYQFDGRRGRYRGSPRLAWLVEQDDQDDQDDRIDARLAHLQAQSPQVEALGSSIETRPAQGESLGSSTNTGASRISLTGAALRGRAEEILRVLEVPVSLAELIELLGLDGVAVGGRPSQTLTSALRVSLARGDVERSGRGRYRWVSPTAA